MGMVVMTTPIVRMTQVVFRYVKPLQDGRTDPKNQQKAP